MRRLTDGDLGGLDSRAEEPAGEADNGRGVRDGASPEERGSPGAPPDEPEAGAAEEAAARGAEPSSGKEGAAAEGEAGEPLLEMPFEELKKALEAVLFAVGEPLAIRSLAELFGKTVHDIREAVEQLRYEYIDTGRSFRLEDIAGGVQLLTLTAYDPWIRKLRQKQSQFRLSQAAFETLSVIAYKQPITKADLESIRGVQCGQVLKSLLDRGLARVVGRDESLGRPLLYGTTQRFLESFGISSIRELPQPDLEPRKQDWEEPPADAQ